MTILQKKRKAMNKPIIKLQYIGKQMFPGYEPIRLWNIVSGGDPELHPDGSTISLESLKQMGVI